MSATTRRPKRVGHKGADHIAPGNTLESFAALERMGVDGIITNDPRLFDPA